MSLRDPLFGAEEGPGKTVPPDLAAVMQHARRTGAEYILFDADAVPNAELAIFAWRR